MSSNYTPQRQDYQMMLVMDHQQPSALCVSRILLSILGSDAAIMFAAILGHSSSSRDGWFAKSIAEWCEELGLSESVVIRCLNGDRRAPNKISLQEFGVDKVVRRRDGTPTNHYRINWDRVNQFMAGYDDVIEAINKDNVCRVWGEKYVQQMWGGDDVE